MINVWLVLIQVSNWFKNRRQRDRTPGSRGWVIFIHDHFMYIIARKLLTISSLFVTDKNSYILSTHFRVYLLSQLLPPTFRINFQFFSPTPLASPRPWLEIKHIFGLRFYWIQIKLSRQGYNVMPINHEVFCQCNLKYFLFTNESRHALLLCNHASDNLTAARWRYPAQCSAHILNIINLTDILDLGDILQ